MSHEPDFQRLLPSLLPPVVVDSLRRRRSVSSSPAFLRPCSCLDNVSHPSKGTPSLCVRHSLPPPYLPHPSIGFLYDHFHDYFSFSSLFTSSSSRSLFLSLAPRIPNSSFLYHLHSNHCIPCAAERHHLQVRHSPDGNKLGGVQPFLHFLWVSMFTSSV